MYLLLRLPAKITISASTPFSCKECSEPPFPRTTAPTIARAIWVSTKESISLLARIGSSYEIWLDDGCIRLAFARIRSSYDSWLDSAAYLIKLLFVLRVRV